MFMVVYSHVVCYRSGFSLTETPLFAENFIIGVNMPLFFMISGYFSNSLHESKDWRRIASRLIGYVWPMAFFAIFFSLVDCVVFGRASIIQIPVVSVKKFLFSNWFFYTLSICDVITFTATKYGARRWISQFICAAGFAMALLSSGRIWYSAPVVAMVPFYWFGLYVFPRILQMRRYFAVLAIGGCGIMFLVTFVVGNIATNGLSFYWNRFDVFLPCAGDLFLMLARYCIGILGSLFIVQIVIIATKTISAIKYLAFLGRETLGIYFLQGFVVHEVANKITGLDSPVITLLAMSAWVYLLCFLIVKVSKKNSILKTIIWGVKLPLVTQCHPIAA